MHVPIGRIDGGLCRYISMICMASDLIDLVCMEIIIRHHTGSCLRSPLSATSNRSAPAYMSRSDQNSRTGNAAPAAASLN
jgi:hypothetical protein